VPKGPEKVLSPFPYHPSQSKPFNRAKGLAKRVKRMVAKGGVAKGYFVANRRGPRKCTAARGFCSPKSGLNKSLSGKKGGGSLAKKKTQAGLRRLVSIVG